MPIGKNKTRLAVTLDLSTAKNIEDMAEKDKRTVSAMLAILINEASDKRNKSQYGFIRGADYYKTVIDSKRVKDENADD